jgi:hypothetical protein
MLKVAGLSPQGRAFDPSSPCGIIVAQNSNGSGFSPNTSIVPCQYYSVNAAYSLIDHQRCITTVMDCIVKLGNPDSVLQTMGGTIYG